MSIVSVLLHVDHALLYYSVPLSRYQQLIMLRVHDYTRRSPIQWQYQYNHPSLYCNYGRYLSRWSWSSLLYDIIWYWRTFFPSMPLKWYSMKLRGCGPLFASVFLAATGTAATVGAAPPHISHVRALDWFYCEHTHRYHVHRYRHNSSIMMMMTYDIGTRWAYPCAWCGGSWRS